MIHRLKIAVLREIGSSSIESGANILKNLSSDKYVIYDVLISREGDWYLEGVILSPGKLFQRIDFVFNSSSNLQIQRILNDFNVPFIGSDVISFVTSKNKMAIKEVYKSKGIKTPYYSLLRKEDYNEKEIIDIFRNAPMPCVIKSTGDKHTSSPLVIGNAGDLIDAVEGVFEFSDIVLIEEFILGETVTCGVIEGFRKKEDYTFLPIGLGGSSVINKLSKKQKDEVQQSVIDIHKALGLNYYSTSDFVVSPKRGVYVIGTNSSPELSEESLFVKALDSVGSNLTEFLEHLIDVRTKRL